MLLFRFLLAALAFSPSFASARHLVVSSDARYLQRTDGTPFVWIGDTAWELFHRLDREESAHYLQRRAAQGFTVIQAVALAENDGLRTPNAYGDVPLIDLDPERPNERYFAHVDWIVAEATRLGLVIGLLPTWGDKLYSKHPGAGPIVFTPQNAHTYGAYLGSRYRDASIVWILGGDRNVDSPEVLEIWRAMARGLREGDGGSHLITFHPRGPHSSSETLHNEPWLDFNMYQSGHAQKPAAVYRMATHEALLQPRKPFVDAEPPYEDIPVAFWEFVDWSNPRRVPPAVLDERGLIIDRTHFAKGFFDAHDVRIHAYWNFLSGACGYTYGNNAVWQMYRAGQDIAIPCLFDWRESLERPGAQQMKHVRALFESRPLAKLIPDQSLVYGPNPEGPDHVRAAGSTDRTFALLYLPQGKPVAVVLGKTAGDEVLVRWFDPRTGDTTAPQRRANSGIAHVAPPDQGPDRDWVLMLDQPQALVKIAALIGDSITLHGMWDEVLGRTDVVNWGIGGYTTGQLAWTFKDVVREHPAVKVVFLQGGINDLALGIPADRVFENQIQAVAWWRAKGVIPVVQSIILQTAESPNNTTIAALNARLRAHCEANSVTFLDLNSVLSEQGSLRRSLSSDGTHLLPTAYPLWGKLVNDCLHRLGF